MQNPYPIPRAEYPRPDRQRGRVEGVDWLNLNGPWDFRFDRDRRGRDLGWHENLEEEWPDQIIVPFCWESLAAWGEGNSAGNDRYFSTRCFLNPLEITLENHRSAARYEVGWYRREIHVPATGAWHAKQVILTLGAADFFTDCWCNGIHLGSHEGGYVPMEFDLTEALSPPDADGRRHGVIVVRVEDPMDNREQPVGKQWGWYTTTSGIWQTVFVEPRSRHCIESFRIFPDIDLGRVGFEVSCENRLPGMQVSVEIIPPGAPSFMIRLDDEGEPARGDAEIHPVLLWDTVEPRIYRVVFRLHDEEGQLLDEVRGYFGMRKISTGPADQGPAVLCLNNKPIYLRGALYQSYHPEGVYTAADEATLRNDIQYAIRMGFDFLRIHIKLDDPILLYHADMLGMLLMQDFPNFGEGGDTPAGRRRFEEMMVAGMKRDFNHPSIISWCIFNETWGFGGQSELMKHISPNLSSLRSEGPAPSDHGPAFEWIHRMWNLAKSIDSTRLIEDMSVVVWEHLAAYGHVDTDVNSWHFYINDYTKARDHIEDVVAKTYHGSTFNYIDGYSQRNVPLINSEYGGVGALDGDQDISWSFKFLTNELRRHGQLSAYIYTQLMDVEWEFNGFLNYDRTPKEFGYHPSMVNQGDVLPIHAPPIRRVAPGERVEVEVLSSHFARRRRDGVTLHWLYSGVDSLARKHAELARGHCRIPFRHHRVELARKLELVMPDTSMFCTLTVSAVATDGTVIASNYVNHFVSDGPPPEEEEREAYVILRRRAHDWSAASWEGGPSNPGEALLTGSAHGVGAGYFEWEFGERHMHYLDRIGRMCLLMEASSRRDDTPQTDAHRYGSRFTLSINGFPILASILPDHPHDSRGALSYLRGGRGAYGYLVRSTIENELLETVIHHVKNAGKMIVRIEVSGTPAGGLTIYDYDSGRFPVPPTLLLHWKP